MTVSDKKMFIAVDNTTTSGHPKSKEEVLQWASGRLGMPTKNSAPSRVYICQVIEECFVETPPVKVIPFTPPAQAAE